MTFREHPKHGNPEKPCSNLGLFRLAQDRDHLRDTYLPLAKNYLKEPEKYAVPEKQPPGSVDWSLHDMRIMFCCAARKHCSDQVRKIAGDDLECNRAHLTANVAPLFGVDAWNLRHAASLTQLYEIWADILWNGVEPYLRNPGLAQMLQEGGGLIPRSQHFCALLLTMPRGNALEGAYGYGLDLAGTYVRISPEDPMSLWIPNGDSKGDPSYRFELFGARAILREFQEADKIVSLGAGWLPEIRHAQFLLGSKPELTGKVLYAFDYDDRIPSDLFGGWTDESGIQVHYERKTLKESLAQLHRSKLETIDLVYSRHIMTYLLDDLPEMLGNILPVLRIGGQFTFDLQIDNDIMQRNVQLFGLERSLPKNALCPFNQHELFQYLCHCIDELKSQHPELKFNWQCEIDDAKDPMGFLVTLIRL